MPLSAGTRLGPYEIVAPIGAGGMGEVYRAKDTKLKREVAIKVLPEGFASDPERMARLQREAEVLASLNHPNIAAIYGVEDRALVMELVEGESPKGPLPFDDAWKIASQVAPALEYAHDKGIVHRDLKPANIKITPEGVVKLLDFGLAKAFTNQREPSVNVEQSPTLTIGATEVGVILGTAAYMSPEQARGKNVDKRADIWAFGVLLYELLTGERLFRGEDVSETLAQVLTKEPDLDRVPPKARKLLRRCLEKDPKKRLRDVGDAWTLLEQTPPAVEPFRSAKLSWGIAGVLAVALAAVLWGFWSARQAIPKSPYVQLDIDVGDAVVQPALSPDGSLVVFVSKGQLAMRRLDQMRITPIAGTEGASFPFFSPDGQWVAFYAGGKLKKVALEDGTLQAICDVQAARGGAWGQDGFIVTSLIAFGGLTRVSASGGTPQPLTDPKNDPENMIAHRWPQVLPGGKDILFSATYGPNGSVRILRSGGKMKTVVSDSTYGRYLPSGHLLYVQSGTLLAAPVDLDRGELTGPPMTVASGVRYTTNVAYADFDVSPSGTLVYVRGPGAAGLVVSWIDSTGQTTPFLAKPANYRYPRLSPDGKRLSVVLEDNTNTLWVYDLARETMTKLPMEGIQNPIWTPDGEYLVFGMPRTLGWTRLDGSAHSDSGITGSRTTYQNPWSISPDGKQVVFSEQQKLWTASLEKNSEGLKIGQPQPLVQNAGGPAVSPDGAFVAYSSTQSGRAEIYVAPFAQQIGGAAVGSSQVSNEGGGNPIWSRGSRELFYGGTDRRIWVVEYTINGGSFLPGKAHVWSPRQLADVGNNPSFDMDPSGKRAAVFLYAGGDDPKPETHLRVTLNLSEELRRRAVRGGKL